MDKEIPCPKLKNPMEIESKKRRKSMVWYI
jgi:hypothetical protein